MPFPKSSNVGTLMDFLNKDKPEMGRKQKVAIALSEARKNGGLKDYLPNKD